jgi:DNA-binding transcriptional LysR family regulator
MRIVLEADEFDPSQASRTFTVAANNYAARAVVPDFVRLVATLAPSVVVEVRPIGMLHTLDQLDAGTVELALDTLTDGGERFKCVGVVEDDYVAILSGEHPVASEPTLSSEHIGELPHITITSARDDTQFVDDALAEHGLARRVWTRVPLHSLLSVLIGSKALAVVPRRVAASFITATPLIIRPLPFVSPRVSLSMIWHRRLDHHPAHRWLRATLQASVKGS